MQQVKRLIQMAMMGLFGVSLVVPSFVMLTTPDADISQQEKRELAQAPEFNLNQPFEQ